MTFLGLFILVLCLAAAAIWFPPPVPATRQSNPLNGPIHILTQER